MRKRSEENGECEGVLIEKRGHIGKYLEGPMTIFLVF